MSGYKYILWDIDGTVLDFLAAEKAAIKSLFLKFGFEECSDEKLQRYSAINVKYWKALERNEMTKPEILVGRFKEFFSNEGIDPKYAEDFNAEYQIALGDTIVFCENAEEIIKYTKDKYILAAVTNGTKIAQIKKLKNSGLYKLIDYIFISEEVGAEKPNREFFDKVFESMEIEKSEEVLIIGDSLTSDILGGINTGIATCWYNAKGLINETDIIPTYTINNLIELKEIL